MKSVANYISILRIILVLTLYFIEPLNPLFITIYIISGISDMIDGFVARKMNTASKLGEKLDSAADFIMVLVLIIKLYPVINPSIQFLIWIFIIGIVRIVSTIIVFFKFKAFGMLHTYANKITGFMLFAFPIFFAINSSEISMYVICIIASISAIEEMAINILSKELQANRKSITKLNNRVVDELFYCNSKEDYFNA